MTAARRFVVLLVLALGLAPAAAALSPLEPPSTGGVVAVDRALARLSTHRWLLAIAAPPDDEDTSLLSRVGRGMDGEVGIDIGLPAIAATVPDAERRSHAAAHLDAAQVVAERTRAAVDPARLGEAVPGFVEILKHLRAAHAYLDRPEERPAGELIAEKIDIAEAGLAAAAGIAVDATTERETLVAGEAFPVQAVLWNRSALPLVKATVELAPQGGAGGMGGLGGLGASRDLAAGALAQWDLQASVPAGAPVTTPYFLRKPLAGGLYDGSEARPLTARFSFKVDGVPVTLEREVVHRHRDPALGEIRRPLRIVPRVKVGLADELLVWPTCSP